MLELDMVPRRHLSGLHVASVGSSVLVAIRWSPEAMGRQ